MSSFDYLQKTAIKQQGCTLQQVADASERDQRVAQASY